MATNIIKNGNLDADFKVGSSDCKIYLGDVLVYPHTPSAAKFSATYSGGQTYSAECNSSTSLASGETRPSGYAYTAMTSAVIGDCVTSIGDYAFRNCYNLSSVTIPSGVTSIGQNAFAQCSSLSSVTITDSITTIGEGAFQNCDSLSSVTIPSSVTSIGGYVFYSCDNLTDATILNNTIPSHAFNDCFSLSSVTIGSGVTSIGNGAFRYCSGLTSVVIPSSVTSIDYSAFYGCSGLTSVTVEATTPPTLGYPLPFAETNCPIYVPCESVDTYKAASDWSNYADRIRCATIQEPCFDVVDNISSYSGTDYVDVYAEDDSKWYKLNNLNEYEEYGIYETGSSLSAFTYYDGKLVAIGEDEYQYNDNDWELVGEYITGGGEKTYEIEQGDDLRYQGELFSTSFKIPIQDVQGFYGSFNIATTNGGSLNIGINGGSLELNNYDIRIEPNSYRGIVTSDADYLYFSMDNDEVRSIIIDRISYYNSGTIHIIGSSDEISYNINPSISSIYQGFGMLTNFKIPYEDVQMSGNINFSIEDSVNYLGLSVYIDEFTQEYTGGQLGGDTYTGTVTDDGAYYYFEPPIEAPSAITIGNVNVNNGDAHIIFGVGGNIISVEYVDKEAPEDNVEFSTMEDALEYECPWVGMTASIDNVPYIFSDSYEWLTKYDYVVVSGQYICSNGNKYEKLEQKIRNTDGTWSSQSPAVYRQGALIEASSQDCSVCTINFCGENSTGGTISIDNGTSRITSISNAVNGEVGTATQTIGAYCFGGSQLTSLTIANTVTTIEHEAFNETDGLTTLTIPSSVTQIDFWAFTRCTGLTEVIFEGTTPPTFTNQHSGVFHDYCPPVIYVPNESVEAYRAIDGSVWTNQTWSTNIIQPISSRN